LFPLSTLRGAAGAATVAALGGVVACGVEAEVVGAVAAAFAAVVAPVTLSFCFGPMVPRALRVAARFAAAAAFCSGVSTVTFLGL